MKSRTASSRRRRGAVKEKQKKNPNFSRRLRSMGDILAARHVSSPVLQVGAGLRSRFIFFTN